MSADDGLKRLAQHQISELLQAELLHTLGSYRLAGAKLETLRRSLGDTRADTALREVVEAGHRCNEHLRDGLHRAMSRDAKPDECRRHPSPYGDGDHGPDLDLLLRISDFYETSATALSLHFEAKGSGNQRGSPEALKLGGLLAVIHDPQRRGAVSVEEESSLIRGRLDRTLNRLAQVNELLPPAHKPPTPDGRLREVGDSRAFREILDDHAGVNSTYTALHLLALEAMSEAHMCMHQAEHLRSQSFGPMFTEIPETNAAMETVLQRSVVLNTFAYVVGRSMPWVFAENEE
jgi:hypothetical protein